jgi:hypothetical protein
VQVAHPSWWRREGGVWHDPAAQARRRRRALFLVTVFFVDVFFLELDARFDVGPVRPTAVFDAGISESR